MKRTVLTFGIISGLMFVVMMFATIPFVDRIGFGKAQIIGYTTMVLSFLMVFFGIRSYRDNVGGGQISFGRAFAVGSLIMLIGCAFYVVTWEIIYFKFIPDFPDKYANYLVEKAQASGSTPAEIAAIREQVKSMKAILDNPFLSGAIAFIEPLPVGLVMTLISAAILRRKHASEAVS